ncbi:MAG: hypothetical protein AAF797_07010 [Planctomycetota bacterium]
MKKDSGQHEPVPTGNPGVDARPPGYPEPPPNETIEMGWGAVPSAAVMVFLVIGFVLIATALSAGPIETKGGRFIVTDPVTGDTYSTHTLEQKAIETAAALSEELGGVEVSITREPVVVRASVPASAPEPAPTPAPQPAPQPDPVDPPAEPALSVTWADPPNSIEPKATLSLNVSGIPPDVDVLVQAWDATAEEVVPVAVLTEAPWSVTLDLLPGQHELQAWPRNAAAARVGDIARHALTVNGPRPPETPPAPPVGGTGGRTIYVSSSGGHDEENTGLSPQLPFRTVARAMREVRDGTGDIVLFRRGDVWQERVGNWNKSGRSADEPITLTYYGDANAPRPKFDVDRPFIEVFNRGQDAPRNLRIDGLHAINEDRNPNRPGFTVDDARARCAGINWLAHFENITVEDCIFEYFSDGLVFTPIRRFQDGPNKGEIDTSYRGNGLVLRHNIIRFNYATWIGNNSGKSQGVYIDTVDGFVAEENVFFRNGWHPDVQESVRNRFNHNIYMSTRNGPGVIRNNWLVSAGSHGAQMRSGGVFEGNVVLDSPLGAFVTARDSAMRGNTVLLSPVVTTDEMADGVGLQAFGLPSVEITGNVIGHLADTGSRPRGRPLEANDNVGTAIFTGNVVTLWPGTVRLDGDAQQSGNQLGLEVDLLPDLRENDQPPVMVFKLEQWPELEANLNRLPGTYAPDVHGPGTTHTRIRERLN